MGSQLWSVFTPFGDDTAQILVDARDRAFRNREYGKPWSRGEPQAKSIEALVDACAEDGTCSIIDVTAVCEEPGPGIAGRIPLASLKRLLGTTQPTRAQAEQSLPRLAEALDRGEAAFVVCYDDGKPVAVLFFGWSFD